MITPTFVTTRLSDLPTGAAVYALHGGRGAYRYVGYVGISDNLRRRINHHLVQRSSSVVTGVSVASLNPDLVTEVTWWQHKSFADSLHLAAAELVAFDVLNPTLRSRQATSKADAFLGATPVHRAEMEQLFSKPPHGRLIRQTVLQALERLDTMEQRVAEVERRLDALEAPVRLP